MDKRGCALPRVAEETTGRPDLSLVFEKRGWEDYPGKILLPHAPALFPALLRIGSIVRIHLCGQPHARLPRRGQGTSGNSSRARRPRFA